MTIVEKTALQLKQTGISGKPLFVAVSGGADSVALLHILHQLNCAPLTVLHLNHCLRGKDSDQDEQFTANLAKELKLPFISEGYEVRELAEKHGWSLEMAARHARHDFFARTTSGGTVALAHHADDQAETFLLKLARGAGPDGLSGMPVLQDMDAFSILRPMLEIRREEIIAWLETNDHTWREDASNLDDSFLRNRVRHEILPMLADRLNPDIGTSIRRSMEILREENSWMDSLTREISIADTTDLPLAARRRIVRRWLFENGAEHAGFDAVDTLLSLMNQAEGSAVYELNGTQRIVVEYGVPRFVHAGTEHLAPPNWKLSISTGTGWKKDTAETIGSLPAEASFNADKIGNDTIAVRCVQPGDRMRPLGMEGSRKLQDIFTDLKVPKARRMEIPVVVCRGEIIWIPGYRTARGWEVEGTGAKSIHVRIERM